MLAHDGVTQLVCEMECYGDVDDVLDMLCEGGLLALDLEGDMERRPVVGKTYICVPRHMVDDCAAALCVVNMLRRTIADER